MNKHDIKKLIKNINIPQIRPETNFWLVRTKQGFFYDEFIENGFMALGWNSIDKKIISRGEIKNNKDEVYKKIQEKYEGTKQPGHVYNKCNRFINEIKENDIIMLPGAGSSEIAFALAGEYYEEEDLDYKRELEVITQIEEGWGKTLSVKCPYKKRRKIKVLKTVSGSRLNPNLYKTLVSRHSISRINDSADYILSSIFNIYYWNNEINYVFNVEKEKDINPVDISQFIMSFACISQKILSDKTDINRLNGRMNINSPGDIVLTFVNCANNIFEFLTSNKFLLIIVWISLVGGEIQLPGGVKLKLNSLLELINSTREINNKLKNDELKREVLEQSIIFYNKSKELNINNGNFNNVIDIQKYFNQDD